MLKRQRHILLVGIVFIVILIVWNILSYSPQTEIASVTPVVVGEIHEYEKLQQQIEQLNVVHRSHQDQIFALRESVQRLHEEIKHNKEEQKESIIIKQNNDKKANIIRKDDDIPETQNNGMYKLEKPELIRPAFGSPFQLIPENEIIYPDITISNNGISDTPSSPNAVIIKDKNKHNVIYERENGIIHGNPLLIDKCSNVLTVDHEINILSSISYYHNQYVPWFWSRETIGSVLQNQKLKMHSNILASDNFDNSSNAIYIKIDNSASKIMENTLLKSQNILQEIDGNPNTRIQSKCGFTFIQHPITRFIAAYFEVNALLWREFQKVEYFPDIFEELTFYKIIGDLKGRLKAFVNDLRKFHYVFITLFPWINILSTQIGQISFSQNDIDHIFKYEFIQNEYQNILNDPNDQFCIDESDHFIFNDNINNDEWNELLFNYGINKEYLNEQEFREWIGLKIELNEETNYNDIEDLERMDILYIYDAMDYEIYSKIVEYYWQDFVCLDYSAHYKHDVLDYLVKEQNNYPGFPMKNRTKTNWDLILEYYYDRQNKQKRGGRGRGNN